MHGSIHSREKYAPGFQSSVLPTELPSRRQKIVRTNSDTRTAYFCANPTNRRNACFPSKMQCYAQIRRDRLYNQWRSPRIRALKTKGSDVFGQIMAVAFATARRAGPRNDHASWRGVVESFISRVMAGKTRGAAGGVFRFHFQWIGSHHRTRRPHLQSAVLILPRGRAGGLAHEAQWEVIPGDDEKPGHRRNRDVFFIDADRLDSGSST